MLQIKQDLLAALGQALATLAPDHPVAVAFESPKVAAHGDFACTAAMQLAKPLQPSKKPCVTCWRLAALTARRRQISAAR